MNHKLYWTVDIGGTKILLLLIDQAGKVLYREKKPTPKPSYPETLATSIEETIKEAAFTLGISDKMDLGGLAVCTAGFVDAESGVVHQSPNLEWHKPVPLEEILAGRFSCPILVENDTNAAVVGEVCYGAAQGHNNVIYVTLSTGIGGGFLLNGRLYRGSSGFAGEIGHTKPFGKGRKCKCGGYDCLEAWASGSAMVNLADNLRKETGIKNNHITAKWVFEQADSGNKNAKKLVDHAASSLGTGLANLVTLLNPTCLVIGGGIAAGRTDFLEQVTSKIKQEAIKPAVEITPLRIVSAELEPEAGIWGAYALITGRVM